MSSQHRVESGVVYPALAGLASPHVSGDGAMNYSYTGSTATAIDCTALAGRTVDIYSEVTSDASDGSVYRFVWHTSATPPSLVAADTAGVIGSAARYYGRFSGANPATQVVDPNRPYLIFVPGSSISTAENIVVAVSEPVNPN